MAIKSTIYCVVLEWHKFYSDCSFLKGYALQTNLQKLAAVPLAAFISLLMAYKGYGIWALVIYTLLNTV